MTANINQLITSAQEAAAHRTVVDDLTNDVPDHVRGDREAQALVAALAGSLLPNILQRLGIDPAIAGGVILTTITDVAGFCLFLGLATWAYA